MAGNKERRRALDRKTLAEGAHLLPRERASVRLARERVAEGEMRMDVDVGVVRDEVEVVEDVVRLKGAEKRVLKVVQTRLVSGGVGTEVDED